MNFSALRKDHTSSGSTVTSPNITTFDSINSPISPLVTNQDQTGAVSSISKESPLELTDDDLMESSVPLFEHFLMVGASPEVRLNCACTITIPFIDCSDSVD